MLTIFAPSSTYLEPRKSPFQKSLLEWSEQGLLGSSDSVFKVSKGQMGRDCYWGWLHPQRNRAKARFSLSLCFGNPPTLSVLQKPTCRCIDTVENGPKCQLFARRLPKRFCGNHPPTQKVILQESHLLLNPGSGTLILSSAQCGTVSNEPLLGNCNARALSIGFMDTGAAPWSRSVTQLTEVNTDLCKKLNSMQFIADVLWETCRQKNVERGDILCPNKGVFLVRRAKSGMRATVQKKETKKKMDFCHLHTSAHFWSAYICRDLKWFDSRLLWGSFVIVDKCCEWGSLVVGAPSQWKVTRCTISPLLIQHTPVPSAQWYCALYTAAALFVQHQQCCTIIQPTVHCNCCYAVLHYLCALQCCGQRTGEASASLRRADGSRHWEAT